MITGGRLGDLFGRKKMFMGGAVIFAVGSYICSISHNVPTMIVGESIIEGIGAALMMPATMSLLVSTYRGRDRSIAFGIWGGVAGASTAIGPLLGGWITSAYSWRWAFRINIFVAALLLAGSFLIKESRDREESHELDWLGVILFLRPVLPRFRDNRVLDLRLVQGQATLFALRLDHLRDPSPYASIP